MPPQPLEVERESGSFTLSADDTTVEIDSAPGLRQVNAPAGALAAYRFNGRPVSIVARIQRIAPVLKLADRVTARLEETRLVVSHALNLTVEKAGIYALDLAVPPGFVVSEVKGEGMDDWKAHGRQAEDLLCQPRPRRAQARHPARTGATRSSPTRSPCCRWR